MHNSFLCTTDLKEPLNHMKQNWARIFLWMVLNKVGIMDHKSEDN